MNLKKRIKKKNKKMKDQKKHQKHQKLFIKASKNGHTKIVRLLLANPNINPAADDNHAIRLASLNGHTEIVRLLLGNPNVNPAAYDNFAINRASYYGYTEVVRLLLSDERVDPAATNNFAIKWSSFDGYTKIVKLLLNDPRVDWRLVRDTCKKELIKNNMNELKNELTMNYLLLKQILPTISFYEDYNKTVSILPKNIIRKITYLSVLYTIPSQVNNIPSIRSYSLTEIMKIKTLFI